MRLCIQKLSRQGGKPPVESPDRQPPTTPALSWAARYHEALFLDENIACRDQKKPQLPGAAGTSCSA